MELRICSDTSIKLKKFVNLVKIDLDLKDYYLEGETLKGNIEIYGNYMIDEEQNNIVFNELVPFTVVFKNKNYFVNNIEIENLVCNEIINQGIDCHFDIIIKYSYSENENSFEKSDNSTNENKYNIDDDLTKKNDIVSEVDLDYSNNEIELLKSDINEKYDTLLQEILETRDDNFLENNITITEKQEVNNKVDLNKVKEKYYSYRIFYPNKESEIERICNNENISIDKVYKDNANTDFINKKRIIIK